MAEPKTPGTAHGGKGNAPPGGTGKTKSEYAKGAKKGGKPKGGGGGKA